MGMVKESGRAFEPSQPMASKIQPEIVLKAIVGPEKRGLGFIKLARARV